MNHPTYRLLASLVEVCRSQVDTDVYADLAGQLTQVKIALSRSPDDGYIYALAEGFLALSEQTTGRTPDRVGSTPGQSHLTAALKALRELPRPTEPPEPPPEPEPEFHLYRGSIRESGVHFAVGASDPSLSEALGVALEEWLGEERGESVDWDPETT